MIWRQRWISARAGWPGESASRKCRTTFRTSGKGSQSVSVLSYVVYACFNFDRTNIFCSLTLPGSKYFSHVRSLDENLQRYSFRQPRTDTGIRIERNLENKELNRPASNFSSLIADLGSAQYDGDECHERYCSQWPRLRHGKLCLKSPTWGQHEGTILGP